MYPTLRNAPITEAVLDFRVAHPAGFDPLPALEALARDEAERYPQLWTQRAFEGRLTFQEEGVTADGGERDLLGYMIRDREQRWVVQLQRGGLTVSRLRPYQTWDELFQEAWRLWSTYTQATQPESVNRLATRFLNHIKLPVNYNTEEYFKVPIHVPEGLPDVLVAFQYRYVVDADNGLRANVTLSTDPVEQGSDVSPVLFDIDCYRQEGFLPDDPSIQTAFGNLRALKNRIFFESLTPRTLDLFR